MKFILHESSLLLLIRVRIRLPLLPPSKSFRFREGTFTKLKVSVSNYNFNNFLVPFFFFTDDENEMNEREKRNEYLQHGNLNRCVKNFHYKINNFTRHLRRGGKVLCHGDEEDKF